MLQKKPYIHCKHFTEFPLLHRENLLLLRGKFVNVIGKPHNLFRETLVKVIGKYFRWGNTITFIGKGLQELLKFPTTVCMYVCFPLLIFRSEMFPSRRRYHLTTICPRDTYGSHLGLTWLSPKNII